MRQWLARRRLKALDALVHHGKPDMRFGLYLSRNSKGKLVYRLRGGFGHRWLPAKVQHVITAIWNPVACHFYGHDFLDEDRLFGNGKIVCTACCKEWKV